MDLVILCFYHSIYCLDDIPYSWNASQMDGWSQILWGFLFTLLATFAGVYLSTYLSGKQERKKNIHEQEASYKSALGFLVMELSFNEQVFQRLYDGLGSVPRVKDTIRDNAGLLVEASRDVRSVVFDNIISAGASIRIRKNHNLFNALHYAYFDLKTGIDLLPMVFEDPENQKDDSMNDLLDSATKKVGLVLERIKKAKGLVESELRKYGELLSSDEI